MKNFKVIKCIGRGGFGKVMMVMKDDMYYAMKSIRKRDLMKQRLILQTRNERMILQTINHPNIVKLHYAFQTKQKLYLVMDMVNGGELFFHLKRMKQFKQNLVQFYCAEILLALEYLHSKKIIYRDLKAENILLDCDGHIKLTDLGLAKILQHGNTYTVCGTPEYVAPEVLLNKGHNKSADWWSFGVIMYELLAGHTPFISNTVEKVFHKIVHVFFSHLHH